MPFGMIAASYWEQVVTGPKKPRSPLGHLSTYGALPINGGALVDLGGPRPIGKFGDGQKLGTGLNLVFTKRTREQYDIEADGQVVGQITSDPVRAYDKRWQATISIKHYLASPDWPLVGRSATAVQELLRKHW